MPKVGTVAFGSFWASHPHMLWLNGVLQPKPVLTLDVETISLRIWEASDTPRVGFLKPPHALGSHDMLIPFSC